MEHMKIFLDIDGVLADFCKGSHEVHGLPYSQIVWPYPAGCWDFTQHLDMTAAEFWAPLDFKFWSTLPWMDDAHQILETLTAFNLPTALCTTPPLASESITGKVEWVRKNLPEMYRHLIVTPAKQFCAHPWAILIDDADHNIRKWRANGGHGILIPRIWNSKHALIGCNIQEYLSTELEKILCIPKTD